MFQAKWSSIQKESLSYIKNKIMTIIPILETNQNQHIKYRCSYIVNNIDDPWGHETLRSIMNTEIDMKETDVKCIEQIQKGKFEIDNTSIKCLGSYCGAFFIVMYRIGVEIEFNC